MNFAALLSVLAEPELSPAEPQAVDEWRSLWDNVGWAEQWPAEDAANWFAETGVLGELMRPRPFEAFVESGIGLARAAPEARYTSWTETGPPGAELPGDWDEAVELTDGSLLVYPNDDRSEPTLSFYAPLQSRTPTATSDQPTPVAIVGFQLSRWRTRQVAQSEAFLASDGMCARWLVTTPAGGRDLVCRPDQCPGDCRRVVSVKRGGIRTARCAC